MTPERWRQITVVFNEALGRDSASRAAFLDEACAADHELREEVEAMLDAHRDSDNFGAALDVFTDVSAGQLVGQYKLLKHLGSGGMGDVWRAQDVKLNRDVALKTLRPELAESPEMLRRFVREAKTTCKLVHSNVCVVLDFGESAGLHYIAMEYLEGETLERRIVAGRAGHGCSKPCRLHRLTLEQSTQIKKREGFLMEQRIINPWKWQDQFGFVQGKEIAGGQRVLYCAGQAAIDTNGQTAHPGDMRGQLKLALNNVETVLNEAGFDLSNVVRLNYYTTDVDQLLANWDAIVARLDQAGCRPSSTLLGVSRLAFPELLIEIEATAVK